MSEQILNPSAIFSGGRVHFIGIGGAGMSAIARLLLARGVEVSGSDAKDSAIAQSLRDLGARVWIRQSAEHVQGASHVVYSTAIRASNPERAAADAAGLPLWHRSQALAAAMRDDLVVAVAGTHGKTTTTSMVVSALRGGGVDPSFAIGATVPELGTSAAVGSAPIFVAEADESDGSFLNYRPHIAVLTNVEPDHLDFYGTPEKVRQAFEDFLDLLPSAEDQRPGLLIACADDVGALNAALKYRASGGRVVLYGTVAEAELRLSAYPENGPTSWRIDAGSGAELELTLSVPGEHNALNAVAALAVARELGADMQGSLTALSSFRGASRRFEFVGEVQGVRVFDDYAHHPTEVAAALRAARSVAGSGAVRVIFQPHLFSRTQAFAQEFGDALELADQVQVLPIYPAREDPIPGITSELIAGSRALVHLSVDGKDAISRIIASAREGDVVITVGAGNVTELGAPLIDALKASLSTRVDGSGS